MRLHHVGRQCFSPIHPVQRREAMLMRKVKEPCTILKTELIRQAKGITKEFVPIIVVGRISLSPKTKTQNTFLHPKCEAVTSRCHACRSASPCFFWLTQISQFQKCQGPHGEPSHYTALKNRWVSTALPMRDGMTCDAFLQMKCTH